MRIGALSFDPVVPPASGRVIGVFRNGIAWQDRQGELHSLAVARAGNAGATTLVDVDRHFSFHDTGITPDDGVECHDRDIRIGVDRLVVEMAEATEWQSPEPGTLQLDAIKMDGAVHSVHETLGPFVGDMARALLVRDEALVFEVGRRLVGRGVGLTPSGDDLLGGILAVGIMTEGVGSWIGNAARRLSEHAEGRTTIYSVGMLRHIARGRPFALLTSFLFALAAGNRSELCLAASRLAARGATSGREAALGTLLAVHSLNGGIRVGIGSDPCVVDRLVECLILGVKVRLK